MSEKHPTIMDIAKAAGVAKSTVSLALRGSPKVKPEKRDQILKVAKELGYRPNPLVAAHMSHVRLAKDPNYQETLGFLYESDKPESHGWKGMNRVYREYVEGAVERSRELGYEMEPIMVNEPGMSHRRLDHVIKARGIRGLVMGPSMESYEGIEWKLDWDAYSTCAIGYSVEGATFHRVFYDAFTTLRIALIKLEALGYKRIGLVISQEMDARVQHAWAAGCAYRDSRLPKKAKVKPLVASPLNQEIFEKWYIEQKPEVIMTLFGDVRVWLSGMDVSWPDRVGVADLTVPEHGIAGYRQDFRGISAAAVDLVTAQINRNEIGIPEKPKTIYILGEWIDGRSLKQVKLPCSTTA